MPLPEPILDDLRFQRDLVDEARRRIIRYCPEWTDYNVSDPGITLIELFAWMTELLTYRLNRVPEKNYIKFLELLDVQLKPPTSARAPLTLWLSIPFPVTPGDETTVLIPQNTEVATPYFEAAEEVIFTTDEDKIIYPPKLIQLRREDEVTRNFLPNLGLAGFRPFGNIPQVGDTFYLGFDAAQDMSGHLLQLMFECEEDRGTGIRRRDPPLVWECSIGGGGWREVTPSVTRGEEDTTGGFNTANGSLVLYLPLDLKPDEIHGRTAYWIRCRYEIRRTEQGKYAQSPRIMNVAAYSRGATTWATHAQLQDAEILGISDGEPGQTFKLQHTPVLTPRADETVEVEELQDGELVFVPWQCVQNFAHSNAYDRHYTLELATGVVSFGPGVRQQDGTLRQYGRIPEIRRQIRVTRYRHGGGAVGNVPAGKIQVLRTSLAYVARISNLVAAEGGLDQETLDEAKMRARRELHAQNRAVTAADFLALTKSAAREVARVQCLTPSALDSVAEAAPDQVQLPPGIVTLLVVPTVHESLAQGNLAQLKLLPALKTTIRTYLDQYRLLTTPVNIQEPKYVGVQAIVKVALSPFSEPENVRSRIRHALRRFISPLALPAGDKEADVTQFLGPDWEGWPFGKDLYGAELFSLIQKVPGVRHVLDVQIQYRQIDLALAPTRYADLTPPDTEATSPEPPALTTVTGQRLVIGDDTLFCSLDHQIEFVSL